VSPEQIDAKFADPKIKAKIADAEANVEKAFEQWLAQKDAVTDEMYQKVCQMVWFERWSCCQFTLHTIARCADVLCYMCPAGEQSGRLDRPSRIHHELPARVRRGTYITKSTWSSWGRCEHRLSRQTNLICQLTHPHLSGRCVTPPL